MKRLYFIILPASDKRARRQWITTNTVAAMEFVHSFGLIGFNLWSKPYIGQAIESIEAI